MNSHETHTLATELRDFPEWHHGIRHYAVWTLPVETPAWLERIAYLQQRLAPLLHPGYHRQPHITLFACGLVDNRHFPPHLGHRQAEALRTLKLSTLQVHAGGLSTFTTAPWLGIHTRDSSLSLIRRTLAGVAPEDSPARDYRPHITLGFYRHSRRLNDIHTRLAAVERELPPLPPLPVKRLQWCHYATNEIQGRLAVKDSIELKDPAVMDSRHDTLDPLEAIRQMRKDQLRVCALKQQAELDRLVSEARGPVDKEDETAEPKN